MKEFNPTDKNGDALPIRMVVGLGNPGEKYEHTYHNVGALFVRELETMCEAVSKIHSSKKFGYSKIGSQVLISPHTFMNESGDAVREVLRFFKETPNHLLVVHDDSDLFLGTYKIDFGRGAAGHRGVASIINLLHTKKFYRLRIGIRLPPSEGEKRMKASEFVLKKIKKRDWEILSNVFQTVIT